SRTLVSRRAPTYNRPSDHPASAVARQRGPESPASIAARAGMSREGGPRLSDRIRAFARRASRAAASTPHAARVSQPAPPRLRQRARRVERGVGEDDFRPSALEREQALEQAGVVVEPAA